MDPQKRGLSSKQSKFLLKIGEVIFKTRFVVTLLFVTLVGVAVWTSAHRMRHDPGKPAVFRPHHNMYRNGQQDSLFETFKPHDNDKVDKREQCGKLQETCSLYACNTLGRRLGSHSACLCFQEAGTQDLQGCSQVEVGFKIVLQDEGRSTNMSRHDLEELLRQRYQAGQLSMVDRMSPEVAHLKTTHWESGIEAWVSLITMKPKAVVNLDGNQDGRRCESSEVCYCNIERCDDVHARASPWHPLTLPLGGKEANGTSWALSSREGLLQLERRSSGRRLATSPYTYFVQEPAVPATKMVKVNVVIGLDSIGYAPVLGKFTGKYYKYNDKFDFADPWTQRMALNLCADLTPGLRVGRLDCALSGFAEWAYTQGYEWPLRKEKIDASAELRNFASTKIQQHAADDLYTGAITTEYLWFGADGRLQALRHVAFLDVPKTASPSTAIAHMEEWDAFMEIYNEKAGGRVPGWTAWHTSPFWVTATSDQIILDSTLTTVAISMSCVFLGVIMFTRSPKLALINTLVVLCVIALLFFFMVTVMNWGIGAIEVLSLIVFTGFAVDYSLHIGHKYHSCDVGPKGADGFQLQCQDSPFTPLSGKAGTLAQAPGEAKSGMSFENSVNSTSTAGGEQAGPSTDRDGNLRRRSSLVMDHVRRAREKAWSSWRSNHKTQERKARAKWALERIGSSVFGSALTTIGCAAFLIDCEIYIFMKIGCIVVAVTLIAIVFALCPLPAVLMIIGPCGHDFKPLNDFIARLMDLTPLDELFGDSDDDEWDNDEDTTQYNVINMPVRGIGQVREQGGSRHRSSQHRCITQLNVTGDG